MDGIGIAEFLDAHATAVLSLARDDEGYAVPVAVRVRTGRRGGVLPGQADGAAYRRVEHDEDATVRTFVEAADVVSLVVHDADARRSVVVRGSIEALSGDALDATVEAATRGLSIPSVGAADEAAGIARVNPREVTGVAERE